MSLGKKTGGRVAGTPNKSTAAIKELGGQYGPEALAELARLATNADSEQARVSACKELLDRAYGKAPQYIEQKAEIVKEEISDLELARRVAYLLTKH
jgi:ferritin-like protein